MYRSLSTDFINALSKATSGLKALAEFPRREKEKYRQTLEETFRLIDTTLNIVIIRLGDILFLKKDFMDEATRLDNYDEWLKAERPFRLCDSPRAVVRQTVDPIGASWADIGAGYHTHEATLAKDEAVYSEAKIQNEIVQSN